MESPPRYIANMGVSDAMPVQIKAVYEGLRYEVAWLHAKWAVFAQLFCRVDHRADLLSEMLPGFEVVVRDSLWNELTLGLCRLTDGATTGKNKENLTLKRLQMLIGESEPASSLSEILDQVDEKSKPLRHWRNRCLAHSDLPTALGQPSQTLPALEQDTFDDLLGLVAQAMNLVEQHFLDSEMHYQSFTDLGDGDDLLFYLEQARALDQQERAEILGR